MTVESTTKVAIGSQLYNKKNFYLRGHVETANNDQQQSTGIKGSKC